MQYFVQQRIAAAIIIAASFGLICNMASAAEDPVPEDLQRLPYNNPGLAVDLGVGLWAWPLPMDWDSDGDLDLVVSCPDKPYNGVYFFENPDGAKMPIFKPAVRLGPALPNAQVAFVQGQPRVMSPGIEYTNFLGRDFSQTRRLHSGKIDLGNGRKRANQWKQVDYDNDGRLDLIVGIGYWGDYGWDDAFNEFGEWTRGPLHGYVFLLRNNGTQAEPSYTDPIQVTAEGQPIDVFGMPSPSFADFDADGDLDLLCGEFLDGFTYFQNTGTRSTPRYATGRRLNCDGQSLAMDLCMITPTAVDWDGDGDQDLVCGDEDGRVALIEHTGTITDGVPEFLSPKYFQQEAADVKFGALVTPVGFDWDDDGDEDIIAGNTAGYIAFIENLGSVAGSETPRWNAPVRLKADGEVIRIQAGPNGSIQGPCEAKWGYTTLSVADWDHDGLPDVIANSIWGKVIWFRNTGSQTQPKLSAAAPIRVEWPNEPPKPAWNWWSPDENQLVTQWRTTPVVVDWDQDGLNDLVMLDHEGFLAFFRRERRGDRLALMPGQRLFDDAAGPLRLNPKTAGGSGRRKLCVVDWDGDGLRDFLINSENASLLRNTTHDGPPWRLLDLGPVAQRRLAGHTSSPATVNWNGGKQRELLVGAEDGYLYYMAERSEPTDLIWIRAAGLQISGRGFRVAELQNGALAFGNRTYTWFDVPDAFHGSRYTQTLGGETAVIYVNASKAATIHMATSASQTGFESEGWQKCGGQIFGYTDAGRTKMQIYQRQIRAGEMLGIRQAGWTGSLLIFPAL